MDDECSVDLQLCIEDDEDKVMKEEEVMHISVNDEEAALITPGQTETSKSPHKTTGAEEDPVTDHSNTHESVRIEETKEVEVERNAERRSKVQKKQEGKLFPCHSCGLISGSSANLKKHMMTHTGEKPFKCRSCLKAFRQRHHLVDHWRIHSGERPFECEMCGKYFVQKSSLNLHKKKHSGIKAFSCNECDYATYQKTHLRIHMRIHTGEKPYQCEKCGQTFSSSTRLKFHRMIHTGERPYKCEQCGVRFREKVTLQAHMAVHLNVGPFVCEECGQEFSRLAGLSLHRRVHVNRDDYLYVYNKEANKSFNSAVQKASFKVSLLKKKRDEENEKYFSPESAEKIDTEDAGEADEPATNTSEQDMSETLMDESQQTPATPAEDFHNLNLSPEDRAAPKSKLPWGSDDSDQHKLKENLASSLKYDGKNSDINPDQVREALERGTVLETHNDDGKGFFIVLPPALQNKDIMVLSDPSESTTVTSIHIPESNVTLEDRDAPPNIMPKSILEIDKVPNASVEEEVKDCGMDPVGMEEICSEDEEERLHPLEVDSVECMIHTSGADEVLGPLDEYSEPIEKQLHPDGTLLLQWKENSSSRFNKITYIIEDGKDLVTIEEENCATQPKDGSPTGKAKRRKLKGSENIQKRSEKIIRPEFEKYAKILKKCRITKAKTQRVYNCEQCGKTCKNSSNYIAHLRIHSGERPYFCGICRMGFKQISHLKSHIRIHTGERPYVCNLCNAAFTQSSRLNAHKKSLHPSGQVEIKERKRKYVPEKRIQNFFCRYCNKTFIGECLKIDHMKLHQSLCPFICKICGMQFKSKSTMLNHILKHSDFKHICELCGAELLSLDELHKHKTTEHGINAPNSDLLNMCISVKIGEAKDFMVLNPAMKSSEENHLSTKIKAESSEDPNSVFCEVKEEIIHVTDVDGDVKSEIEEVALTQDEEEMAIHDITLTSPEKDKSKTPNRENSNLIVKPPMERPCSQDDIQEIIREGEIKDKKFIAYIDTTGKKVWVCKVCDRSFTQSSNLYCHMRMHTGDKPYLCNVCPKAFRQITHLKDHMRRHTGAKPHKCSACGKCFSQRSAARRHIMGMHRGEGVTERIPENQMSKEIINTLSSEHCQRSRGAKKALIESKEVTLQADENSCKLAQKEKIPYTCKICNKQFTHSTRLGTHSRRCGKLKKQKVTFANEKCYNCGDSFESHTELVKHQEMCSAIYDETSDVETASEKYKRKITSRSDLEEDSGKDSEKSEHRKSSDSNTQMNHDSFLCRQCGEVLSSIASLKSHMEGHNDEVHQLCMMCGESFKRASALRYHQSMKHGREDRRYKDYCPTGYVTVKEEELEENMEMEKVHLKESDSEYEEVEDSASTDEDDEMMIGVEVNGKVSPKKKKTSSPETKQERAKRGALNTICNKVGKVTRNIKDPSKGSTGSTEKYVCTTCGVAFTRSSKLKHHEAMWCRGQLETHKTDTRLKPLKENSPTKVNKVKRKVENERKSLRSKKHENPSNSSSVIVHKSSEYESEKVPAPSAAVDSKGDAEQSNLKLHCKICDKHFPDKHSFDEHVPTHEANRPFKCHYCSLGFKRKAHLFNHYRRHVSLAGMECL